MAVRCISYTSWSVGSRSVSDREDPVIIRAPSLLFFFFPLVFYSSHVLSSHFFFFRFSLRRRDLIRGSLIRLFSPLSTTVCAFIFIARRNQRFPSSLTRVELRLPTLLRALNSYFVWGFIFRKCAQKSDPREIRTPEATL